MQHRIFVVAPLGDPPHLDQRQHWEEQHGPLFSQLPGLRGYRQNRPVDREWATGRGWFCSETWFDDRRSEARSFATDFYRDHVTPDEETFLAREHAWQAAVLDAEEPGWHPSEWRVLWFGNAPPAGAAWRGHDLTRAVPGAGDVRRLHSAWFETEAEALALTSLAPPEVVAFACRPHSFVAL